MKYWLVSQMQKNNKKQVPTQKGRHCLKVNIEHIHVTYTILGTSWVSLIPLVPSSWSWDFTCNPKEKFNGFSPGFSLRLAMYSSSLDYPLGEVSSTLTEVHGRSRKHTFSLADGLSVHDAMLARSSVLVVPEAWNEQGGR